MTGGVVMVWDCDFGRQPHEKAAERIVHMALGRRREARHT